VVAHEVRRGEDPMRTRFRLYRLVGFSLIASAAFAVR
jgi:hypothetical protein